MIDRPILSRLITLRGKLGGKHTHTHTHTERERERERESEQ